MSVGPSAVAFPASDIGTSEGAGRVTLNIKRAGDLSVPAQLDYATTDGSLTQAERNAMVAGLDSLTRADVLRAAAWNQEFGRRHFNRAFVLMRYFGYLRRNPNDPPEQNPDFTGYNFWLDKLEQFNGNFVNAEMVKAFIPPDEYQRRFGP